MSDALKISRKVYELLLASTSKPPPAMRSWTGETWGPADAKSTIVLQHPGALRAAFFPPSDLVAGEAYVHDDIDFEGDIVGLLHFGAEVDQLRSNPLAVAKVANLLRRLPADSRRKKATRPGLKGRLHSSGRDRAAIRHHYDTGNNFFAQFLDPELVYSCAYFLDANEPLEVAQHRKLDLICRKLQLRPGQQMLDVGCGWGALVRHAAANYGVTAVGVTLSPEQAAEALRRVREEGLEDRVTIKVNDYREIGGRFDAIASIGMFEHVGADQLANYFSHLHDLLTPSGVLLNHGITNRSRPGRFHRNRPSFVNTYVFPDGELTPIETSIATAEAAGFEARDIESLRSNYALTLRHWVTNIERNREAAIKAADEITYRIWRMYMAGSAVAFERNAISVYQTIFAKEQRPWTFGRKWATAGDDS